MSADSSPASRQQTAAIVADLDKDGRNDFVLAFRETGPALLWYRRTKTGWDRYVIEKDYLRIEAGGAVSGQVERTPSPSSKPNRSMPC